ncbi:MAG: RNA methyltransferase [Treponema sp.]|nr:RNA methyltransferase [Treponema sp.]
MLLQDIKIVLSRVSEPGNVGAVCRAMKNMGLFELRIAAIAEPLDTDIIYERAVNARDIWDNTRIFNTLAEATADCSIIVGTTRRRGQKRNISMPPGKLACFLKERKAGKAGCTAAAIVFGNERTGLDENELKLCNFASHIPVCEAQPSLNLSHAVQIYAYELFLAMEKQQSVKGEWTAMNQADISALVGTITDTLESVGFYKNPNKQEQARFLRNIISRAALTNSEGEYFKEIINKAVQLGGKT